MLLRILNTNQAYNLILFPVIAVILWSKSLLSPGAYSFYPGEDQQVLFKPLFNLTHNSPFLQVLISLVIVILIGFLIQNLNSQFAFIRVRSLLPSSYFIILVGGFSVLHTLHPVLFAALFVMFALNRVFDAFEKKNIFSNAFDTGILIGAGSLFYFNLIFIFPAFILGLAIINREFSWRELVLFFWGVILPWVFTFSYFFFFDNTGQLLQVITLNITTKNTHIRGDLPLQLFLGYQALLILIGSLHFIKSYDRKKISSRKYFIAFFLVFIFSIATTLFVPSASLETLVLISIPVSYLISNFFVSNKKKILGEVLFAIFLGLAIVMQFT